MSVEAVVAFVLGGLWALAGASSVSRPRLRLGNYFVLTCWLLAGAATAGAALGVVLDVRWPATWLVLGLCGAIVAVRIQTSRQAASGASAEGRAALAVLGVGLGGAVGTTAAAVFTRAVLDWPDRVGLVATTVLAVVAGLTTVVHVLGGHRGQRAMIWLLGSLGSAAVLGAGAVAFVHLLAGDVSATDVSPQVAVAAAASAAVVGVLIVPATLLWITTLVNRGRPDPTQSMRRLDEIIQRRLPIDETLLQVCELMRASLLVERAEAWTVANDELRLIAADPHRPSRAVTLGDHARRVAAAAGETTGGDWVQTWLPGLVGEEAATTAPVTFGGELQGLLVAYGGNHDEGSGELVERFSHGLGPAMHSASLDVSLSASVETLRRSERDLRASRERLVAAADLERARIERDLHDGAQQHLVALSVNLELARGLVQRDPARATELLGELAKVARNAVEELRSLSHGIFPKTLEDEGVGPALDESAQGNTDVRVKVTTSGVRRFAREIETAVYFVCNEAITNAVKHAEPQQIAVNIVGTDAEVVFEVLDDGCGFDVSAIDARHGMANMADRIGAVDGELTITSDGAGTRVLGRVPLAVES